MSGRPTPTHAALTAILATSTMAAIAGAQLFAITFTSPSENAIAPDHFGWLAGFGIAEGRAI